MNKNLQELQGLLNDEKYTKTFTTKDGKEYEVEFDKNFLNSKIKDVLSELLLLNDFIIKKCGKNDEVMNLTFAVLVQRFTDKNFVDKKMDLFEKFKTYVVVAKTLQDIELEDGSNLLSAIIDEFGAENISKLSGKMKMVDEALSNQK